jgi:hypothetical protein
MEHIWGTTYPIKREIGIASVSKVPDSGLANAKMSTFDPVRELLL